MFPPYAWFVQHVVLPAFPLFGWLTLLTEAALGAFLLIGLLTRFWALVEAVQSLAITPSVLNAPNEWHWSYYLMILVHVALFAMAAGRSFGVDEVLRPTCGATPDAFGAPDVVTARRLDRAPSSWVRQRW